MNMSKINEKKLKKYIEDWSQSGKNEMEYPFCERVKEGWQIFLKGESLLRQKIDDMRNGVIKQNSDELVAACLELLNPVFQDICFETGYNGEKHELILTAEGDKAKLFPLIYFQKHAPKEVLERWNIIVGRRPFHEAYSIRMFGQNISMKDVWVWIEWKENKTAELFLYCEKLVSFLQENENDTYWLMCILLDQAVGEIPSIRYIDGFELLEQPKDGEGLPLTKLFNCMQKTLGLDTEEMLDAAKYCETYTAYELKPDENIKAGWRKDVFVGITSCVPLISEYLQNESRIMDSFYQDGITAGSFSYSVEGFTEENRGKQILDFRDQLEAEILEAAGEEAVTFIGGASGIYCCYLDFIAWNPIKVLEVAAEILKNKKIALAEFYPFWNDKKGIRLK